MRLQCRRLDPRFLVEHPQSGLLDVTRNRGSGKAAHGVNG